MKFVADNQTQILYELLQNVSSLHHCFKNKKGNSKIIHIQATETVEIWLQVILNLSIKCRRVGQPHASVTLHLGKRLQLPLNTEMEAGWSPQPV